METRWVRSARLVAVWVVFWSSILPMAVIIAVCIGRVLQGHSWTRIAITFIIGMIAFPFLSLLGLILQALLIRPFVAFSNWLLQ